MGRGSLNLSEFEILRCQGCTSPRQHPACPQGGLGKDEAHSLPQEEEAWKPSLPGHSPGAAEDLQCWRWWELFLGFCGSYGGSGGMEKLDVLPGMPWGTAEPWAVLMAMLGAAQSMVAPCPHSSLLHHCCCRGCAMWSWWDSTPRVRGIAQPQGRGQGVFVFLPGKERGKAWGTKPWRGEVALCTLASVATFGFPPDGQQRADQRSRAPLTHPHHDGVTVGRAQRTMNRGFERNVHCISLQGKKPHQSIPERREHSSPGVYNLHF